MMIYLLKYSLAAGSCLLAAVGVKLSAEERIKAVEKGAVLDIEKEDKIRQYHPIDSLFDYFSSYQLIDNKGCRIYKNRIENRF